MALVLPLIFEGITHKNETEDLGIKQMFKHGPIYTVQSWLVGVSGGIGFESRPEMNSLTKKNASGI